MTNDKQVEVWRKQFQSLFDDKIFARGVSGGYINDHRNSMWHGFCLAKRSMQPIELPELQSCEGIYFAEDNYYHATEIHAALNKAGIAYRVEK